MKLKVIADDFVDPQFGTGVVKVTPAHDKNDYEAGLRHKLEVRPVIGLDGKLNEKAGKYAGLSVVTARKEIVAHLQEKGLIDHIDDQYVHTVTLCKAGHVIEPMVMPNWFIKVDAPHKSFKKPALDAVKEGKVKIFPKWREITYIRWMEEMRDWPISRQNVWGIQIPVWYEVEDESQLYVWFTNKQGEYTHGTLAQLLKAGATFEEITEGLQRITATADVHWVFEQDKQEGKRYLPETDTFDTWFSSGQWPLVTLGYPDSEDFKYFYPTSVMETGWEIIRLWVSRMIMFGIYLTGEVPFKDVYLHGIVKALDGRKMSKSLGNIINPDDYISEYGVDALRMGLISGTANGKDFSFPRDRVIAYKHFSNKLWNMGRFILLMREQWGKDIPPFTELEKNALQKEDKEIVKQLEEVILTVDRELEKFRFADAGEAIYQFTWHTIADKYIEQVKAREDKDVALSVLQHVFVTALTLLHPFMPFVTDEIYQKLVLDNLAGKKTSYKPSLMITPWPSKSLL